MSVPSKATPVGSRTSSLSAARNTASSCAGSPVRWYPAASCSGGDHFLAGPEWFDEQPTWDGRRTTLYLLA